MKAKKLKFRPVFIVGHPRSGSTLLASILGSHSSLAAIPETHYLDMSCPCTPLTRVLGGEYHFDSIMKNNRIIDSNVSLAEFRGVFSNSKDSYSDFFRLFLELAAKKQGKQRILEKTPRHLEYVEKLLRWYPEAKVICIIRDGRDAVNSLVDVAWTHSNIERHAAYWGWCVRRAIKLQKTHPDHLIVIRFEDLLSRPKETLQQILSFIDEPYEDQLLQNRASNHLIPAWEKKWKERSGKALDQEKVFLWKKNCSKKSLYMESLFEDELKLMRYEVLRSRKITFSERLKKIFRRVGFSVWYKLVLVYREFLVPRRGAHKNVECGDGVDKT